MKPLQVALEEVMRGKRGFFPSFYRMAVTPLAWGYAVAVFVRNGFYDRRLPKRVSIPVVSVGNVAAGGTGKTDVVTALAEELPGKLAIVSRGYGVKIKEPFVVEKKHQADECGDEPRMLADRLPNCLVVVGPDRVAAIELAKKRGAQLVILDDGMQHRRLHRDYEIVVASEDRFFLPKGLLRDDPKRLQKADFVITVDKKLQDGTCQMQSKIEGIFTLFGKKVETIRGAKVALFCAIGNPSRFVKTVEDLGAKICEKLILPDHKKADEKELKALLDKSGADYLVCTEKDKVKLKSDLPILWIKRRLVVDENDISWQKALATIKGLR